MSWEELIAYNRRWVQLHEGNNHQAEAARRMTVLLDAMEALLADDVVERAARAEFSTKARLSAEQIGLYEPVTWESLTGQDRDACRAGTRAALTAAIEGDE